MEYQSSNLCRYYVLLYLLFYLVAVTNSNSSLFFSPLLTQALVDASNIQDSNENPLDIVNNSPSSIDTTASSHPSTLLSRLKYHEIAILDSLHLHPSHQNSINKLSNRFKTFDIRSPTSADDLPKFNNPRSHDNEIKFQFQSHGQPFDILLSKNNRFISNSYSHVHQVYSSNDARSRQKYKEKYFTIDDIEHCYYRGYHAVNLDQSGFKYTNITSGIAIHTCGGGLSGLIKLDDSHFIIEPAHAHVDSLVLEQHVAEHNRVNQDDKTVGHLHLVYKWSDYHEPLLETHHSCGVSDDHFHDKTSTEQFMMSQQDKSVHHQPTDLISQFFSTKYSVQDDYIPDTNLQSHPAHNFRSLAFSTSNPPTCPYATPVIQSPDPTTKYIELLIVNDNMRYKQQGQNTEQNSLCLTNLIDQTYIDNALSPPIQIVLIGQITFINKDPYTVSVGTCTNCAPNQVGVDDFLSTFNAWRRDPSNSAPYANMDAGHLFSGYPFETPVLGYAGVGAMCNPPQSGGIESVTSTSDFFNSIIAAHEIGHNLGSLHDSVSNSCPQSGFIMNAVVTQGQAPTTFSSCSQTYINQFNSDDSVICLDNVPTSRYGAPICGNGFVEAGEQCDCGSEQTGTCAGSVDPCCNAATCQFNSNATCSNTNPCCSNCGIVSAASQTICRIAASTCDIAELCDGQVATCPNDEGFGSGTSCVSDGYGLGLCFDRVCQSFLRECRIVGSSFAGGPYDACPQQSDLNSGQYCQTLWCTNTNQQCTFFRQSTQVTLINDGIPCPAADGTLTNQCQSNNCVSPQALNSRFTWTASAWTDCTDCNSNQYRNVTCVDSNNNATNSLYCSPPAQPSTSQLCQNLAAGCVPATDSSDINLFGTTIAQKTLLFSVLGAISLFLVIIAMCYHGTTYLSKEDEHYFKLDQYYGNK